MPWCARRTVQHTFACLPAGVDPADLKKVEKEVKKEVDDAVEAAKAAPIPPNHWLWKNV